MKLVLLPGMDGTGILFDNFLKHYQGETVVIPLPDDKDQNYSLLAEKILADLPDEDFILLVESFSGGLVKPLLEEVGGRMKGIIFVVSFLSPPNKLILALTKLLPAKIFAALPGATVGHRLLFLGEKAPTALVNQFVKIVQALPQNLLKKRLQAMSELKLPKELIDVPAVYIQATEDKLISPEKFSEIEKIFQNVKLYRIDGPHLILQANPEDSAKAITEAIASFANYHQ